MRQPTKTILKDIMAGRVDTKSLTEPVWQGMRIWRAVGPGFYQDCHSSATITQAELDERARQPGPVGGINILPPDQDDEQTTLV